MYLKQFNNLIQLFMSLVTIFLLTTRNCSAKRKSGFFNHTGCLYAYMSGGQFEMVTNDGNEVNEPLETKALSYDSTRSKCTKYPNPGQLVFTYKMDEGSKLKSVSVLMNIRQVTSQGYWQIDQANLTIVRADIDKKRTFILRASPNMYASMSHSYSCSNLTLETINRKKSDNETRGGSRARITLERFQLQPFAELKDVVFGPSYDCSQWMTVPGLMGFILIVFMTTFTVIGVSHLRKIETNDFKFYREGILFTQSHLDSDKRQ